MEEISAEARLADEGVESPLTVMVPRSGIDEALQDDLGADLVLDVMRTNGAVETRRVLVALDAEMLQRLMGEHEGDVRIDIDPESLATAFDDVEAHGLREAGAALAVLVVTAGGGAGMAQAYPADGSTPAGGQAEVAQVEEGFVQFQTDFPSVQAEVVQAGMPRAMPADYAQARASEEQMPRAMPSDYAAAADADIEQVRVAQPPPGYTPPADIEQIRAAQPAPDEGPLPSGHIVSTPADTSMDAIENVRTGAPAVPDPSTAIENVRVGRDAPEAAPAGGGISAPVEGVIVGGVLLTIAAAFFMLRRREPGEVQPA